MNLNRGIKPPVVVYSISFTGTGSTPVDISHGGSGVQQMVFEATGADCYVVFGTNASMDVADSGDWPLYAGQPIMFEVGKPQKFISVIRQAATSGVLKYYIPGEST